MPMHTVILAAHGVMDDLVDRDVQRGLQVAAYLDGQLVFDTWSASRRLSMARFELADPTRTIRTHRGGEQVECAWRLVPVNVLADCREQARMRLERRASWIGAAFKVAVRLLAASWLVLVARDPLT